MADMHKKGQSGSVVSLLCDGGERYQNTYYNEKWLTDNGYDLTKYCNKLDSFFHTGEFPVTLLTAGTNKHTGRHHNRTSDPV